MLFNSINYLIFLSATLAIYFILPPKSRWAALLVASYFFYAYSKSEYCVLLLASTTLDFFVSHYIHAANSNRKRRAWLYVGVIANLTLLCAFKYPHFILESIVLAVSPITPLTLHLNYDIPVPLGLSFFTLQSISYIVDVYRYQIIPSSHYGKYLLYISFFPRIAAGPIERAQRFLPQLAMARRVDATSFLNALRRILWGIFKKVVIADNLALIIDPVYEQPFEYSGCQILLATYLFAFQIYCDFSGYCDIALGSGQVFGFNLSENFNKPYFAPSIRDFWKRWHITLTSWFRDYLYIPLGGNKTSLGKWCWNIVVVFALSALWHGPKWPLLLWGFLHAFYYLFGALTKGAREYLIHKVSLSAHPRLHRVIKVIMTFNLVSFAWIFFRADDLERAWHIATAVIAVFLSIHSTISDFMCSSLAPVRGFAVPFWQVMLYIVILCAVMIAEALEWDKKYLYQRVSTSVPWQQLCLLNFIIILLILLPGTGGRAFIYFQF